jgi:hypothetical protein
MDNTKNYASISWTVQDIKNIYPKWSDKTCEEFLKLEERYFQDFLIEQGNEYLKGLIMSLNEAGNEDDNE